MLPWIGHVKGVPVIWSRPDSIAVLDDQVAQETFSRYWAVIRNDKRAKFLILKEIEVDYDYEDDISDLWLVHDKAMNEFRIILKESDEESRNNSEEKTRKNLLALKRDIARKILESCHLCEWRCGVNRYENNNGVCKLGERAYIASIFIHPGEEPELVPSYTIFFSHCNFKCVYCQNWDISQVHSGRVLRPELVADRICREWLDRQIRNVNWVGGEPTPNIHYILDVLTHLDANVPQIWNSNLYNSIESLKLLEGVIDLWLPDFKYGNNDCALKFSKIPRYFDVVTRNLKMINSFGDEILIRHLVLPNHIDCCSKRVIKWISDNMDKNRVRVNIMAQYRPEYQANKYNEINRRISIEEWRQVYNYALDLGLNLTI